MSGDIVESTYTGLNINYDKRIFCMYQNKTIIYHYFLAKKRRKIVLQIFLVKKISRKIQKIETELSDSTDTHNRKINLPLSYYIKIYSPPNNKGKYNHITHIYAPLSSLSIALLTSPLVAVNTLILRALSTKPIASN